MTIFCTNTIGEKTNCVYPKRIVVTDEITMKKVAAVDHVAAEYRDNRRSAHNFLKADCVPMDCDNDHSDNPDDWVTPFDVSLEFPNVEMIAVYSRNNRKPKENKCARPRFHIYFACNEITDPSAYTNLKRRIAERFPYFDRNALDAGRFLFGVPNPTIEVYNGNKKIDDILGAIPTKTVNPQSVIITPRQESSSLSPIKNGPPKKGQSIIHEGCRNNTMSQYAGRLIKRLGNTQESYQQFLKEAEKCSPPLPYTELQQIWKSAVSFGEKISAQAGYILPNQYQPNKTKTLCPEDFTDVGQARVLSNECSQKLRYSSSLDYMVYNGSVWEESKIKAQELAQKLTDRQLKEAENKIKYWDNEMEVNGAKNILMKYGRDALREFNDKQMLSYTGFKEANEYKNFALKRRSTNCITASLKEVRPMVQIEPNSLDVDEFLLNTPSTTYNLRTGMPQKHNFSDYITKQTSVDPSKNGIDVWEDALHTFFQGDAELISYVQEIAGLASIGKVYNEGLIIAYGEGRNGKSTFWNTILRVLGTYSGTLSADILMINNRNNCKFELAEARGKRLIIASELEEGTRLNTAKVKQLCSTDSINAEKKYKDPFSYVPTHTIVLYTNHLPKVGARDKGTWRRLVVIPFTANIEGKADKKNYADYLFNTAGGAVLSWILEGAKRAIEKNYQIDPPKRVKDAIQRYKDDNDWLQHFLDDCCEIHQDVEEKSGELYSSYRNYCNQMGEYTRSTTDFYAALDSAGYTRYKHKSGKMVKGLHLKSDF